MKIFKVYVGSKRGSNTHLLAEIDNLGIKGVANVKEFAVYWFRGISQREVQGLTDKVLYNPVNQFYYSGSVPRYLVSKAQKVEVVSNLGVIDPREASVKKVASDLGIRKDIKVKFGRLYLLYGKISKKSLTMIKSRLLMKGVIEHEVFRNEKPFIKAPRYKFKLITIPIRNVTEEKLFQISEKGGLSLNLEEMRSVKKYFVGFGVGPQKMSYSRLPKGVLHPKAILSGVVQGTKSYGNQMGIPTDFFQDSLVVHKNYSGNPLVYCGTVGVCGIESAKKVRPEKGDLVVLLGGLTGRDGIHGATFSSAA